jgi:uncharacterized membrane protein
MLSKTQSIHSMLVHFPIALTSAAVSFILLAQRCKNKKLEQAVFANIVCATFGTIATGLAGRWTASKTTIALHPM